MNEEKYISLPLAKQIAEMLKEKGVEFPESELFWATTKGRWELSDWSRDYESPVYPAYDAFEIGKTFSHIPFSEKRLLTCGIMFEGRTHRSYFCDLKYDSHDEKFTSAETEPEARGKMLLYLLKNGLLK